jgi:hypothetical protein
MNNLISPYDSGNFRIVENNQRIKIDELVRNAQEILKKRLVEAQIEAFDSSIKLINSRTRFNGERLWFECPLCEKRAGTLFKDTYQNLSGCRKCLKLRYKSQRYKGMLEAI